MAINIGSGFFVQAASPIDTRYVVETLTELQNIRTAYPGLHTWVKSENTMYEATPDGENGTLIWKQISSSGSMGPTGSQGIWGEIGPTGQTGQIGPTGMTGLVGPTGRDGQIGPTGSQGLMGPTGSKGDSGSIGPTGAQGPKGEAGTGVSVKADQSQCTQIGDAYIDSKGNLMILTSISPKQFTNGGQIKGPQGAMGPTGADGVIGPTGSKGMDGAMGPTGAQGPKGDAGTGVSVKSNQAQCTEIGDAYIDPDGNLMILTSLSPRQFTNGGQIKGPQGAMGPTGAVGAVGPKGSNGKDGALGPTGATGAAGPTGAHGEDGLPGPTGPQGAIGPTGASGVFSFSGLSTGYVVVTNGTDLGFSTSVEVNGYGLVGAVWNDFAEFRNSNTQFNPNMFGHIACEQGDDSVAITTDRLQPMSYAISDTYGFIIGEKTDNSIPVAVAGRALVYTYEDRNMFKVGDAVCSAPNGTVSIMTQEEINKHPNCIIGYVSSIPSYDIWGKDIKVNDRIWIKIV